MIFLETENFNYLENNITKNNEKNLEILQEIYKLEKDKNIKSQNYKIKISNEKIPNNQIINYKNLDSLDNRENSEKSLINNIHKDINELNYKDLDIKYNYLNEKSKNNNENISSPNIKKNVVINNIYKRENNNAHIIKSHNFVLNNKNNIDNIINKPSRPESAKMLSNINPSKKKSEFQGGVSPLKNLESKLHLKYNINENLNKINRNLTPNRLIEGYKSPIINSNLIKANYYKKNSNNSNSSNLPTNPTPVRLRPISSITPNLNNLNKNSNIRSSLINKNLNIKRNNTPTPTNINNNKFERDRKIYDNLSRLDINLNKFNINNNLEKIYKTPIKSNCNIVGHDLNNFNYQAKNINNVYNKLYPGIKLISNDKNNIYNNIYSGRENISSAIGNNYRPKIINISNRK